MSLAKKTENWVNRQIITREQQAKILAFESQRGNRTFWNTAFIIAGSLIGLGFCLLIAANWDFLSDTVKLLGNFALLGGLFYAVYWSVQNKRSGLKELFVILSFLGIGATIGLIGQIFQLSGGWSNCAIAWAALSVPFVVLSRSLFFNTVWVLLLCSACNFKWVGQFFSHFLEHLDVVTLFTLAGMYAVYMGLAKLHKQAEKYTLLPAAAARLTLWATYLAVWFVGMRWGIVRENIGNAFFAYVIVFGFFAGRMYVAVKEQNQTSFKRNAIAAEVYIFLIFSSNLNNLGLSGLGFIGGGLLILFFIWVLRRTTRYIKQMEIFK